MRNTIGMALLGTTLAVATPTIATGCADDAAKIEKLEAEKVQLIEENTRLSVRAATCEGELTATQRIVGLRQSPVEPVERAINSPRTSPDTAGGVEPEQLRVSPLDRATVTAVGTAGEEEKDRIGTVGENPKDVAMKGNFALWVATAENTKDKIKILDLRLQEAKNDPKLLKEAGDDYATQGMCDKAVEVYLQALGHIENKSSPEARSIKDAIDTIFADDTKRGAVKIENRLKVAKFYEENGGYQKAADVYSTNNRPNELMVFYEAHLDDMTKLDFDTLYTFYTRDKLTAAKIISLLKKPKANTIIEGRKDNKDAFMKANYIEIYNIVSDPDRNNVLKALGYEGKTKEDVKKELQIAKAAMKNLLGNLPGVGGALNALAKATGFNRSMRA